MRDNRIFCLLLFIALSVMNLPSSACAEEAIILSKGQALYVPAYSHIYAGSREKQLLLTVTLSIRNTDLKYPVTITSADYYGTKGELIKKYINRPVVLGPFESIRYIVPQRDKSGGSGANFLVGWKSDKPVNQPLIESVMIGAQGQQGISFTSRGQAITNSN